MKRGLLAGFLVVVAFALAWLYQQDPVMSSSADEPPDEAAASDARSEPEWDVHRGGEIVAEDTFAAQTQDQLPYISIQRPIPDSSRSYELHLFQSGDHLLLPAGVRRPEGEGPFPAIIMSSGNGHSSFLRIDEAMYRYEPMMDMMNERGYVVVYANYRNEIPHAYNEYERCEYVRDDISGGARALLNAPCLDHNDYIELIEHVKALPYTDPEGVGTIGVSHAGELQMKAASEISWGAAVPIEGASHEYLAIDTGSAPRREIAGEARLLWLPDVDSTLPYADLERARERVARIDDDMPMLHMGRDQDHLQGVFRLAYELASEAGKNVEWRSVDDELHGYGFLAREEDGSFAPPAQRMEAFETWMRFFDTHLKGETRRAVEAASR